MLLHNLEHIEDDLVAGAIVVIGDEPCRATRRLPVRVVPRELLGTLVG